MKMDRKRTDIVDTDTDSFLPQIKFLGRIRTYDVSNIDICCISILEIQLWIFEY
jgi:hypothetical protein